VTLPLLVALPTHQPGPLPEQLDQRDICVDLRVERWVIISMIEEEEEEGQGFLLIQQQYRVIIIVL